MYNIGELEYPGAAKMSENATFNDMVENVDCVTIDGSVYTPDRVAGYIKTWREKYFDLPLTAVPIVSISKYHRHADVLTENEKETLDHAFYDLESPASEHRFRTEFDFFAALIRASEDNANQVYQLKRKITMMYHRVHARYGDLFDMCQHDYGSKTMGGNKEERQSWFHMKYPALFEIDRAYEDFLEEIDIELERWDHFSAAASRQLTSTENSYKATGRLYDRKPGKYVIDD